MKFFNFRSDTRAVTALEYGLIASLVAVVLIGVLTSVGTNLNGVFNTITGNL